MLAAVRRGALEVGERRRDRLGVARRAPGLQPLDLIDLGLLGHGHDRLDAAGERRGLAFEIFVDADHDLIAALDRFEPRGVGIDQLPLHVAALDRGDRAAHLLDALELFLRLALELVDLARDLGRAVEQVAVFQQVGLVGEDLLHAQRPLLVPRPRQAERLVPGRKLHGAGARVLRQRHRQHLDHDAGDVVLRLRLGEAERVHLHAVAEQPLLRIGDAVALAGDLVPQFDEGAHLADLGDEAQPGVDEERDAADHLAELLLRDLARLLHRVEHGDRGGERKGQLLHRRRSGFLQMIGADVHRIPFRQLGRGEDRHVLDQPHRRRRRKHVGAAREIFLDDVVLDRAGAAPCAARPARRRPRCRAPSATPRWR